jgi:hypothetical protein
LLPQEGSVVWIDGDTPALVVGHGVDAQNMGDGRIYVVELGSVTAIAPDENGVYNFGATPYDRDARPGLDDRGRPANPGGFSPDSPVVQNADVRGGDQQEPTSPFASPSSSSGAPLTPGAPGQFVGDAEPGTGQATPAGDPATNPAVPATATTGQDARDAGTAAGDPAPGAAGTTNPAASTNPSGNVGAQGQTGTADGS